MLQPRSVALLAAGALVCAAGTVPAVAAPPAHAPADQRAPAAGTAATDRGSAAAASSRAEAPAKVPTSRGGGGAVSSVDPEATRIGLRILRRGGNAVDAAVATAAALGVTEPYSAGIGGGGYLVFHNGRTGKVRVVDGRETAPQSMPRDAFLDPETGEPYPFSPERVTSGVSVGVPGTVATWQSALDRWGSRTMKRLLEPSARLAERGFVVDETFALQTAENQERFEAFTSTPPLFLPGGAPPEVGSVFRNPDLARTYRLIGARGSDFFYRGALAREMSAVVQSPPKSRDTDLPVPAGHLRPRDLAEYSTIVGPASHSTYRGYDVYGMPPSSSGGTTVGEALNIIEASPQADTSLTQLLHHYLEASARAVADRGAYVGDPAYTPVPTRRLLAQRFADERACEIDPEQAADKPVPAGDVEDFDGVCEGPDARRGESRPDTENEETTNLTVADRWGNVVEYTLTIEQTGGSGMVVPGRGFLLNNELTDFSEVWERSDPNRIEGGKRPRSSMSPTILLEDGRPFLALGSPGGSTIITTVLQVIVNRVDRGLGLPRSVAEPRASQRNTASVTAEQAFIDRYGNLLTPLGHTFTPAGAPGTSAAEIGAVTAIEFRGKRRMVAVAEPERRGGGSARVVRPR
jgi:gamma-glutamyltranspeptidase/glutathione hydrolase